MRRQIGTQTCQKAGNSSNLQLRVPAEAGFEEAGTCSLPQHLSGRFNKHDEQAAKSTFPLYRAFQISYHGGADVLASFDRDNDLLKVSILRTHAHPADAIDPSVHTLFVATLRNGIYERNCPPLKLVFVTGGKIPGTFDVLGSAMDLKGNPGKGIL